jgi:hypothetical protein
MPMTATGVTGVLSKVFHLFAAVLCLWAQRLRTPPS